MAVTLVTRVSDLATRSGTAYKSIKQLVNGNAADLSALATTANANLVVAINEVKAQAAGAANAAASSVTINDTLTNSTTQTYSVSKINATVQAAVAGLVNGSPGALDTLQELASALGNDPNYAASVTTALGNRIRVDAAQAFSAPQKLQARANIDAYGSVEIGNPDTDFVAVFNAAAA